MQFVTETSALAALCARLSQNDYITIDTEFMRETTYWSRLCLVQLAAPDGEAAIVDPLSDELSLEPLDELLADPDTLKVFHAARQDIEIFYHRAGNVPTPVFDTQIAGMVCGFGESAGYETLVRKIAKETIDKTSRFTDWSRRPLTKRQLNYAIADVTHLRVIYEKLNKRLMKNGRAAWLNEEMAVLTSPNSYALRPQDAWRRIKTRSTNRRLHAVLREVAAWREREAQARNVPRNRVVRDEALLEIAAHPPKSATDLARIRGLHRGFAEGRLGEGVLDAVGSATALADEDLPVIDRPESLPPGIGPLVELFKVLLRMKSEEHHVAQKLIGQVADLERIAANDHADVAALHGWRREIFGEDALALKHGQLALAADGRKVTLVPISNGQAEA